MQGGGGLLRARVSELPRSGILLRLRAGNNKEKDKQYNYSSKYSYSPDKDPAKRTRNLDAGQLGNHSYAPAGYFLGTNTFALFT